jgi:hypothetical protein
MVRLFSGQKRDSIALCRASSHPNRDKLQALLDLKSSVLPTLFLNY